jgi:hypothetical protein
MRLLDQTLGNLCPNHSWHLANTACATSSKVGDFSFTPLSTGPTTGQSARRAAAGVPRLHPLPLRSEVGLAPTSSQSPEWDALSHFVSQ